MHYSWAGMVMRVYRLLFLRRRLYRLNMFLFLLSLRGIGVLNHESEVISGEAWFLRRFLQNKLRVAVDVGGNVGRYAEAVVSMNKDVRLFSFEPHPLTFETLRNSGEKFGYTAVNVALGSKPGLIELYDYADGDGSAHASVHKDVIESIHGGISIPHQVPVTTLDTFASERGISKIDLLKIDTEGNELQVLLGAKRLLQSGSVQVIHFEFNEMNVISRVFLRDFFELLPNFSFFRMLPDGLAPLAEYRAVKMELFGYQNVVAIHSTSPLLERLR